MSHRVAFLKTLIAQHRQMGVAPAELHMNHETRVSFSEDVESMLPDRRSTLERIRNVKKPVTLLEMFEGTRIVENPALEGSAVIVRPQCTLDDPNWLQNVTMRPANAPQGAAAAQKAAVDPTTPWVKIEPREESSEDENITTESLTRNAGINPTTVLLKATEGLDRVQDVVVLRFYKGGAIDMCSTMNRFGVVGALQAALHHVANGEHD